jgi:hypothetical protein
MSLSSLKKSNSLDKLLGAVKEENAPQEKKSYKDERIWKPVMDKTGNGFAIIRFLPAVEGEDMPWAKAQQVNGILRTLLPHSVRMTLYQN